MNPDTKNHRILLIDDNPSIHEDFKKILTASSGDESLDSSRSDLFGDVGVAPALNAFTTESAFQGQEALQRVRDALAARQPYAMAFVDVRMPPGWDGIETLAEIWKVDPDLQAVIYTAYSDYTLDDMLKRLGKTDRFVILKKPFDNVEVLQLANALTEKWNLLQRVKSQITGLERDVTLRTIELGRAQERFRLNCARRRSSNPSASLPPASPTKSTRPPNTSATTPASSAMPAGICSSWRACKANCSPPPAPAPFRRSCWRMWRPPRRPPTWPRKSRAPSINPSKASSA